jgi:hypothetical protein
MSYFYACSLLAVFIGVMGSSCVQAEEGDRTALAHTHEEFIFKVNASYDETFPLFGAYEERKWARGFDPQFIHPSPAHDQQGMVFATHQDDRTRLWANTAFDKDAGHVQYVYLVPDALVTLIDIHLTKVSASETRVNVVYERTALIPEANDHVANLAKGDAKTGPQWADAINGYLSARGKGAAK